MSTLLDSTHDALFSDGEIIVSMAGGTEIRFPVAENFRLARGFSEQLNHNENFPLGLHWPDLDEDLSIQGLLKGDHGQSH